MDGQNPSTAVTQGLHEQEAEEPGLELGILISDAGCVPRGNETATPNTCH